MTGRDEELQRLRRDLYRPDPPAGVRERYEALLAEAGEQRAAPAAVVVDEAPEAEVVAPAPEPPSRRRRVVIGAVVVLAAAGIATAGLLTPAQRGSAERLDEALAPQDGARLEEALGGSDLPWGPSGAGPTVVDVLQRSDLPQLDVWDGRDALGWVQRGTGPLHRELGEGRPGRASTEPLSIVVRCGSAAVYGWTLRGTAPGSDAVRVLASGDADRCDRATVATASLPAGSRITAFDLRVPAGVAWTMAVVVPERD